MPPGLRYTVRILPEIAKILILSIHCVQKAARGNMRLDNTAADLSQ